MTYVSMYQYLNVPEQYVGKSNYSVEKIQNCASPDQVHSAELII